MVRILLKALLAAGITACLVVAAAAGFLSLVPLHDRQTSQPAPPETRSVSDPPPLAMTVERDRLE